jgi:hypothetical protein
MRIIARLAVSALIASAAGMPVHAAHKVKGEWESADGTFELEAQGKGKCGFSGGPVTSPCTYRQAGK